jgi:hypothetical protein
VLAAAKGGIADNWVAYLSYQLMYYLRLSKADIEAMSDEDWAEAIEILRNIRTEQAKTQPFALR